MKHISAGILALALISAGELRSQGVSASTDQEPIAQRPKTIDFRLNKISLSFDFVIHIEAEIPDGFDQSEEYREGPGRVLIFRKGERQVFQTIIFKNIWLSLGPNNQPLTNTARLYDDQGVINVGDFNFDGHEDFAVQTGNSSSYRSPSYSVYFYAPTTSRFQLSKPLSSLIEDSLGFFQVDSKKKRLVTLSKSGCCYHEMDEYAVESNLPVAMSKDIEDGTIEDGFLHITHLRRVKGKWIETEQRVPEPPETDK